MTFGGVHVEICCASLDVRRPAEHDRVLPRSVLLGEPKAGRRVAARIYGAA